MSWSKNVLNPFFEIFGHGGGKIKRKSNILVLTLLVLTLPLCANIAFATTDTTTNTSDQYSSQIDQDNDQNLDTNTSQSSKQQTTKESVQTSVNTTLDEQIINTSDVTKQAAGSAGSTTVTTTTTFTSSQINDAAARVKNFITNNNRLPSYVTISSVNVSMAQFLQLMVQNVINLNSGSKSSVKLITVGDPSTTNATESVQYGTLTKSQYVTKAKDIYNYMVKNGYASKTATTSLGKINFYNQIYTYSKILKFYKENSRLPTTVTVKAISGSSSSSEGSGSTVSSSLAKYLAATTNAQSTSTTIENLAASITKGKTTTYAKAQAIFNYVRDLLSYSYYYNSKKGALGALSSKTANCCDTAHLVVALARAAGIPARYQHGYCKFSDGWYGHVWAQLYVDGKWYYADAISDKNTFGSINNWNLSTYTLYNTYASLPF